HQPSVDAVEAAMDADFNTPVALSVLFDLARDINTLRGTEDVEPRRGTLVRLLDVLGIDLTAQHGSETQSIEPLVELLLEVRGKLRELKQWQLADEIR